MSNLVGRRLQEMAALRASRKHKMVQICSIVALTMLFLYGGLHLIQDNLVFALFDISSGIILSLNLFLLNKKQHSNHATLVLCGILLLQGGMLLFYGGHGAGSLIWIYPIIAAVIFASEFRTGLVLSILFCVIATVTILFIDPSVVGDLTVSRFLVSLLALCLLCNTSSYYYDQAVNYIQSLYREGIEDLAYMDQLTGLANRWSFESWASEKLEEERDSKTITAMIFLDIDNFKSINDTYGHEVGDKVLQYLSSRLKNNVRNKDRKTEKHDYSIARFAGDEFVLLLYGVNNKQDLENILNRILHLFEDCYQGPEKIGKLAVSLGVALYPEDATNLAELTRCADKAMYSAKHNGKNQFHYYHRKESTIEKKTTLTNVDNVTPLKHRTP